LSIFQNPLPEKFFPEGFKNKKGLAKALPPFCAEPPGFFEVKFGRVSQGNYPFFGSFSEAIRYPTSR
jgi:hypothetical protein